MIRLHDAAGDEVRVYVDTDAQVYLEVTDATLSDHPADVDYAVAELDPDDADNLADALRTAAQRAREKTERVVT